MPLIFGTKPMFRPPLTRLDGVVTVVEVPPVVVVVDKVPAAAARFTMLPAPLELVKLVPPPMNELPAPNRPCHWMPACAALVAATLTIIDSTYTCARGTSSWSMTWRIWRYTGSEAVMISELVAGSAWIWPPVDGRADAATGVVDCADAPLVPDVPVGALGFCAAVRPSAVAEPPVPLVGLPPLLPLPLPVAVTAARSSSATFTASAFF